MDIEKVPAADCAAGIADAIERRRLRVLRAAGVPRRHRRQGARGRQDRSTATTTCAAWPTSPKALPRPGARRRRAGSGGCELDRDAVQHRVARERVERGRRARARWCSRPRCAAATLHAASRAGRGPSRAGCSRRRACTASVTSTGSTTSPARRPHAHVGAVGDAERAPRRRGGRAACSAPCPSRARRGCASTSCSSAGRGGRRARARRRAPAVERGAQPRRRRRRISSGASSILPVGVRSTSGRRGCSGPRSMPCGFASSTASDRPSGSAPKPSP